MYNEIATQIFMLISKNDNVGYRQIYMLNAALITVCVLFAVRNTFKHFNAISTSFEKVRKKLKVVAKTQQHVLFLFWQCSAPAVCILGAFL